MANRKSTEREERRRIETLRVSVVRERSPLTSSLAGPNDAAKAARELIGHDLDREVFGILLVGTRNRVTAMHIVSIGSLNGSLVHPREVFKAAILGRHGYLLSASAESELQSTHWLQCARLKMHLAWKFLKMPSTSEI